MTVTDRQSVKLPAFFGAYGTDLSQNKPYFHVYHKIRLAQRVSRSILQESGCVSGKPHLRQIEPLRGAFRRDRSWVYYLRASYKFITEHTHSLNTAETSKLRRHRGNSVRSLLFSQNQCAKMYRTMKIRCGQSNGIPGTVMGYRRIIPAFVEVPPKGIAGDKHLLF